MKKTLIMATNNEHKLEEVRQMIGERYTVKGLADIGCHEDIPETAPTLEGNALQKARYVHEHYGLDCFADDTGLEVDALQGAPGIFTARFAQECGYGDSHDTQANVDCLLDRLKGEQNRHAQFRTVVALIQDGREHLFEGIVEGDILTERTGEGGFGYDPVFAPEGTGRSFAQMGAEGKNSISHRGRAIRKLCDFLQGTLLLLLLLLPLQGGAQTLGEWELYPSYWNATQVVAVGQTVYSLCNGNLLTYDTSDASVRTFDSLHQLSDVHISRIAYCPDAKRLLLLYDNSNIDLLDLDDNLRNISALHDKTMSDKTVRNICIEGSTAYLCMNFGFIELDMEEGVFRNMYQLGKQVLAVGFADGAMRMVCTDGCWCCATDANMHEKSNWKQYNSVTGFDTAVKFQDEMIGLRTWNKSITEIRSDGSYPTLDNKEAYSFLRLSGDKLLYANDAQLKIASSLTDITSVTLENEWNDLDVNSTMLWTGEGTKGLKGYRMADGKLTFTTGPIQPNSPMNDLFYRIHWEGDRLLVAGGINTNTETYNTPTALYMEDGAWTNLPQMDNPEEYSRFLSANTTDLVQDPASSGHLFASQHRNGLVEYLDGKVLRFHNCDNSPLQSILPEAEDYYNYCSCSGLQFDENENLWMMNNETDTIIRVKLSTGKWTSLYYSEIAGAQLCDDYLMHSSGIRFLNSRVMDRRGFFGFDTNGTMNSTRDDRHILRSSITNQDGTSYNPDEFYCMTEDLDGRIWCGTNLGLFVIDDAQTFFDTDFRFQQVKIARNDGSGLADYLLNGVSVNCIAVDGANRKWVGTHTNGIYLLSEDGTEMIQHFTKSDSPLLSDMIQSIAIHPTTGRVFMATDAGLCSYVSDATEAEKSLVADNVVAYPNPVDADYTGPIAVRGLTTDSEVKILTTTGQLVWSGTSQGGTFTWNGCTQSGKRVASGIYHVVANNAEGKKAVVTRIVMIR